jgi:hypothetical protein
MRIDDVELPALFALGVASFSRMPCLLGQIAECLDVTCFVKRALVAHDAKYLLGQDVADGVDGVVPTSDKGERGA